MSANDILDVLNVQRDDSGQPAKKKQKGTPENAPPRQTGMARELYNLIGPNTPPVSLQTTSSSSIKDRMHIKALPWSKMPFRPKLRSGVERALFSHWVKGLKELLEQESASKPYFFDKFNIEVSIPEMVDENTHKMYILELQEEERINYEKRKADEKEAAEAEVKEDPKKSQNSSSEKVPLKKEAGEKEKTADLTDKNDEKDTPDFSHYLLFSETVQLFELCQTYELKWNIIHDRFIPKTGDPTLEDLKHNFYLVCRKILLSQENSNPALIEALLGFSRTRETERKKYLESLLKRTPAEIAEEESLVIEARRFELAAKKMLVERLQLLTLLDSPQSSQNVLQYQSSQGLTNLYNNLMILDKHQKKRQLQQRNPVAGEPVPPPIPVAASSSFKKDRGFQTHLQQYLLGVVKSQPKEPNAIQQMLAKRLTVKEEEAYGLHYHSTEKLTAGVILRSSQRLPGLQQRQSVLKLVTSMMQDLDIPTGGETSWKPVMPTRKTMAKYDELLKLVVALLDVKKGKDKLEAEISLMKSQQEL